MFSETEAAFRFIATLRQTNRTDVNLTVPVRTADILEIADGLRDMPPEELMREWLSAWLDGQRQRSPDGAHFILFAWPTFWKAALGERFARLQDGVLVTNEQGETVDYDPVGGLALLLGHDVERIEIRLLSEPERVASAVFTGETGDCVVDPDIDFDDWLTYEWHHHFPLRRIVWVADDWLADPHDYQEIALGYDPETADEIRRQNDRNIAWVSLTEDGVVAGKPLADGNPILERPADHIFEHVRLVDTLFTSDRHSHSVEWRNKHLSGPPGGVISNLLDHRKGHFDRQALAANSPTGVLHLGYPTDLGHMGILRCLDELIKEPYSFIVVRGRVGGGLFVVGKDSGFRAYLRAPFKDRNKVAQFDGVPGITVVRFNTMPPDGDATYLARYADDIGGYSGLLPHEQIRAWVAEHGDTPQEREAAARHRAVLREMRYADMQEATRQRRVAAGVQGCVNPLKGMDKATLEELVWSHPTYEVASKLGVSDVAVAKMCRRLDVQKPPRGFWAKVRAGKMPHPKGKPTPIFT